uniref:H-NS histone family protein n=2 Tax=Aromatoleum toluolicum TaxID=90060 RepID=A0ABX1NNF0_9RHOO|nr:H-NS histone family protein [Aromatoleum toluolicum]
MTVNLSSYTLPQLKQLGARLEKEIARQEAAGKAAMLKKLRRMARDNGMTLDDVLRGPGTATGKQTEPPSRAAPTRSPQPAKYRHPSKMDLAWSGRGRKPQWVEAWLAIGGALEALATAAAHFEQRQSRTSSTTANKPTSPIQPSASDSPAQTPVTVD